MGWADLRTETVLGEEKKIPSKLFQLSYTWFFKSLISIWTHPATLVNFRGPEKETTS